MVMALACIAVVAIGLVGLGVMFACVAISNANKSQEEQQW